MSDASDVTATVLTYNGRSLLEVILPSLAAQTASGFRVHVVDDGSTDDSLEYLAREWPEVEVFPAPRNAGVTATMARAITTVTTRYVAMLNNDIELAPGWIAEMRAALEAHPEAAAADGKMLDFRRRDVIDGAGDVMGRNGQPGRRGNGEVDAGQYDEPSEVFMASCGAAMFRMDAFRDVGNFDVDLFAYYEDADWGMRARLRGWTARYVPTAVSYHMGSATTKTEPGRWDHLLPRNQLLTLLKTMPAQQLVRNAPAILRWQAAWLVADVRRGSGRRHLRGWWEAVTMSPAWIRKRRQAQRRRAIDPRELDRVLS